MSICSAHSFIRLLCLAWGFLLADWLSLLSKSQVAIRDCAWWWWVCKRRIMCWKASWHELDAGRGHVGSRHFGYVIFWIRNLWSWYEENKLSSSGNPVSSIRVFMFHNSPHHIEPTTRQDDAVNPWTCDQILCRSNAVISSICIQIMCCPEYRIPVGASNACSTELLALFWYLCICCWKERN